jgi:quercetin dioxygenase-like cupin family protein
MLRLRLEESVHEAPAGSFVFIPRGVPHGTLAGVAGMEVLGPPLRRSAPS